MFVEEMADRIARDIFECGYELGNPTERIQFMSGLDDQERGQGGLCKESLSKLIADSIKKHFKSL